jgi:DNA-binding HxlR family transcriptional regulator
MEITDRDRCIRLGKILSLIGDKWVIMVIGSLSLGSKRYNAIKREIGGVSQRMLTLTLKTLERDGVLKRTVIPSVPPGVEYELTELGLTLVTPLSELSDWAIENIDAIENAQQRYDSK